MNLENVKILIVEDHQAEVKFTKEHLITKKKISPKNIKSTSDTREALALIEIDEPHIVFVDFHLTGAPEGYGDGALLLKEITEAYRDNPHYQPYTVAISSHMSEELKVEIGEYSHVQIAKQQLDYPSIGYNRFLIHIGEAFDLPKTETSETAYMKKVISLIKAELAPFNFSALSKQQQDYIVELIRLVIPTIDKRFANMERLYKQVAKKFNGDGIKPAINRAFKETFLKIDNFHDIYKDDDGMKYPKQKEFFQYIATRVKSRL